MSEEEIIPILKKGKNTTTTLYSGERRREEGKYVVNLTDIIGSEDHGEGFEYTKNSRQFGNLFNNYKIVLSGGNSMSKRNILNLLSPEMEDAMALVSAGYTSQRILGRELDALNNIAAARNANEYMKEELYWAEISKNESRITPVDLAKVICAERLANDMGAITGLVPESFIKNPKSNYKWNDNAVPVLRDERGDWYDISFFQDLNEIPRLAAGKEAGRNIEISSFKNMNSIENFGAFLENIQSKTKVRIIQADVDGVTLENSRVLRSVGRKIENVILEKTGKRAYGSPDSAVIAYNPHHSPAKNAYGIIKQLAYLSVNENVEKMIKKSEGKKTYFDLAELKTEKNLVKEVASCLIAREIAYMCGIPANDAKVLSSAFSVRAGQMLMQTQNPENAWMVPLVSELFSYGINNFASDFAVDSVAYAKKRGVDIEGDVSNINSVIYAYDVPDPVSGPLSSCKLQDDNLSVYGRKLAAIEATDFKLINPNEINIIDPLAGRKKEEEFEKDEPAGEYGDGGESGERWKNGAGGSGKAEKDTEQPKKGRVIPPKKEPIIRVRGECPDFSGFLSEMESCEDLTDKAFSIYRVKDDNGKYEHSSKLTSYSKPVFDLLMEVLKEEHNKVNETVNKIPRKNNSLNSGGNRTSKNMPSKKKEQERIAIRNRGLISELCTETWGVNSWSKMNKLGKDYNDFASSLKNAEINEENLKKFKIAYEKEGALMILAGVAELAGKIEDFHVINPALGEKRTASGVFKDYCSSLGLDSKQSSGRSILKEAIRDELVKPRFEEIIERVDTLEAKMKENDEMKLESEGPQAGGEA